MWSRLARALCACLLCLALPLHAAAPSADRVRELVRTAYVWGYPMVDMYAILRAHALDPSSGEYRAPLNHIGHVRNLGTPEDRVVVAPNLDTPYSFAWLDLRAEPVVISLPAFEANRYLSLQISDLYTWIVGYVTPRTNGHEGGDFLVATQAWQGEVPAGIRKVFRSPTELALGFVRTQLLGPDDLSQVHRLQDQIIVRPLSSYLANPGLPMPLEMPEPIAPIDVRKTPLDLGFFDILNWMLRFMPVLPEEQELRRDLADIGIVAGKPFSPAPGMQAAVNEGMKDGLAEIEGFAAKVTSSAQIFGSRAYLGSNYVARAAGAMLGILGNAAEEFLGVGYLADANGDPFDGSKHYRIHFEANALPPVNAFWSITVYTPRRQPYANAIGRHAINSPMVPQLLRDADGGFTIDVQHDSPGAAREANWLPVPQGPFILTFRAYEPGEAIRDGSWQAPPPIPQEVDR